MSAEQILFTTLRGLVADRVYPDVAPAESGLPRIVYQQAGGQPVQYAEGPMAGQENARMQITCWAATRIGATALAKQVEDALVAAAMCTAGPIGQRVSVYEEDTGLRGSRQDFSVWCTR